MVSARRVQFNFSPEAYEEMESLKNKLSVSKSEVVRLSLSVLGWVVEELEEDHTILVQSGADKAVKLAFPFLKVKPKSAS